MKSIETEPNCPMQLAVVLQCVSFMTVLKGLQSLHIKYTLEMRSGCNSVFFSKSGIEYAYSRFLVCEAPTQCTIVDKTIIQTLNT